jgi:D-alanyl-D-alanine carboxypeptidase
MKELMIKVLVMILEWALRSVPEFTALGSIRPKQTIFLNNAAKLILFANELPGYEITGGELHRTKEQQAIYLAKGLSKTMNSRHLDRLAIDLNVFINGVYRTDKAAYQPLADYWRKLDPNNVSGCDWNWDYNHFEMKP